MAAALAVVMITGRDDDPSNIRAKNTAEIERADRAAAKTHGGRLSDDAHALSHQAAARTAEQLDRALRRVEIEPPHRSLGISL